MPRTKGKQVPSVPPVTGIQDAAVRQVLLPLVAGWQMRNSGSLAFVSSDQLLNQLAGALQGSGVSGASGISRDELVQGLLRVSSGYVALEKKYDSLRVRVEQLEMKAHEHKTVA